jgi:hypothetical protein
MDERIAALARRRDMNRVEIEAMRAENAKITIQQANPKKKGSKSYDR